MRRKTALLRLLSCVVLAVAARATERNDIEFARVGDVSLTLDAWVPDGRGPFPAVIIVHGGGFVAGHKRRFVNPLFEPLTRGGFAWFTINYRLAPQYPFPAATDDVARAVAWVHKNAREYKVDRKRIALMGESAGGHMVSYVGARNDPKTRVAAVVSFYGPHDFEARVKQRNEFDVNTKTFLALSELNDEARRRMGAASPITYVHRRMPPFLLIHGTKDAAVPYEQSVMMCAKMRQAGARCEVFTLEGAGHGVENWEKDPAYHSYKAKMVEWLKKTL